MVGGDPFSGIKRIAQATRELEPEVHGYRLRQGDAVRLARTSRKGRRRRRCGTAASELRTAYILLVSLIVGGTVLLYGFFRMVPDPLDALPAGIVLGALLFGAPAVYFLLRIQHLRREHDGNRGTLCPLDELPPPRPVDPEAAAEAETDHLLEPVGPRELTPERLRHQAGLRDRARAQHARAAFDRALGTCWYCGLALLLLGNLYLVYAVANLIAVGFTLGNLAWHAAVWSGLFGLPLLGCILIGARYRRRGDRAGGERE